MKAIILCEELKGAVLKTERCVGKNLSLPVLSNILVLVKEDSVCLRSTNLSIGVEIKIKSETKEEGVIAVDPIVLKSVLSGLEGDREIEIEENEGNLIIKTNKSEYLIKGVPFEDFPTLPQKSGDVFSVDPEDISLGIRKVSFSASMSDIKPEISSVYIYSDLNKLIFVSTDTFRLAEFKIEYKKDVNFKSVIIPIKNAVLIEKLLEETSGTIDFYNSGTGITITGNNIYISSRVVDGIYPDYRQIIPKEKKTSIVILRNDLSRILKTVSTFSDRFNNVLLKINKENKNVEIKSENQDAGKMDENIKASIEGEDLVVNLNHKYISDFVSSINSEKISIELTTPQKPIIFRGVNLNNYTYLVMPMNR